jgi:hypothetical protein
MNHRLAPTPFTDVNFVLDHFRSQLAASRRAANFKTASQP